MRTDWYYQFMGDSLGPLRMEELRAKAKDGQLTRDTLVRSGAEGEWMLADHVPEIFDGGTTEVYAATSARSPRDLNKGAVLPTQGTSLASSNPNLCKCPDCGAIISRRATACPNCGGPLQLTDGSGVITPDKPVAQKSKSHGRPAKQSVATLILAVVGSSLLFYAFSENGKLNRVDAAEEAMTQSINDVSRALAEFEGGSRGALESVQPEKVAEKSDRTWVITCFALGGVFIGLSFVALAIRTT